MKKILLSISRAVDGISFGILLFYFLFEVDGYSKYFYLLLVLIVSQGSFYLMRALRRLFERLKRLTTGILYAIRSDYEGRDR
jgi:hypothetical protein